MIDFPQIRTARVSVALKELSLDQAIALCRIPSSRHEEAISKFLKYAAAGAECPAAGYVVDQRMWTVSERLRLVVQYLMGVADDGPDFSVGKSARLSSYIDFTEEAKALVIDGIDVGAGPMEMRPLLGLQAEALEQLCNSRGEWMIGCIAAQILPVAEVPNWDGMSDVAILAWHKARMDAVRGMSESQFERLVSVFLDGQSALRQFFHLGVGDDGIVCMPNEPGDEVPPGRFRASSGISQSTRSLFAIAR